MEKIIEIPEGYEARIEGNKVILERKESEDERIRKGLLRHFKNKTKPYWNEIAVKDIIAYLEKQKEQKPAEGSALQKAFIISKKDYTLEEKCDASDYADAILPTSITYGENEEEYKLHKIIEAAFIAGQKKEQKPAEWSETDKLHLNNAILVAKKEWGVNSYTARWLEALRDNYKKCNSHWKPSKEQMKARKE